MPLHVRVLAFVFLALPSVTHAQPLTQREFDRIVTTLKNLDSAGKTKEFSQALEDALPDLQRDPDTGLYSLFVQRLARTYQDLGRYADAQRTFERCLQIQERLPNQLDIAGTLNYLGILLTGQQQFAKAEEHLLRALSIRRAQLKEDNPDLGVSHLNIGNLYRAKGQFEKGEEHLLQSLKILEKRGVMHIDVGYAHHNLSILYAGNGMYPKAIEHGRKCLDIRAAAGGKSGLDYATTLVNLGVLHERIGQYDTAEAMIKDGLATIETKLGAGHPDVGIATTNLADLYRKIGQFEKAVKLYEHALDITEKTQGRDGLNLMYPLNNLALALNAMKRGDEAEVYFKRSLELMMRQLPPDHPSIAIALQNWGSRLLDKGELEEAEKQLQRSLEIGEARLGSKHPSVALMYGSLSALREQKGQLAQAKELWERVLEITTRTVGENHANTGADRLKLGHLAAKLEDWDTALREWNKGLKVIVEQTRSYLPALSESEQIAYFQQYFHGHLQRALAISYKGPPSNAKTSAEWLLNAKAIMHESLSEQSVLATEAKAPATRKIVTELRHKRSQLAALINRAPKAGQEREYQEQLEQFRAQETKAAEALARTLGRSRRSAAWITLDEFRDQLPAKSVFIDIARIPLFEPKQHKLLGFHYIAWVISADKTDAVRSIDLGKGLDIDRLNADVRKTLVESAKAITTIGESEAMKRLQPPLTALSEKILHPLLPSIEKYSEWIICPDGDLWLTSWNSLVLPSNKFVVESHLVRHVISGRDLMRDFGKERNESAHVVADPDFDQRPASTGSTSVLGLKCKGRIGSWNIAIEFLDDKAVIYDEDDKSTVAGTGKWKQEGERLILDTAISHFEAVRNGAQFRGERRKTNADGSFARDNFHLDIPPSIVAKTAASALRLPKVARLPGTAQEAEAIGPRIQKWIGQAPLTHTEVKANETQVKSIRRPRLLVLATHGFFLQKQEASVSDATDLTRSTTPSTVALDAQGNPIQNPMLRCGLLLAGCNSQHELQPGDEDGILTGLEIVGMDLRGTELVVLSACETGLGDVRSGEGVAGLRQAFQLAGAKGVLASLWQVPDRETALLMNAFYGELTKGKTQAAALREAQLSRIASRRANFASAHPFFWAAFTLTGHE